MRFADLSVIVPTYNREHYLERALRSVMAQTVLPKEVIVIDDGSADRTRHLVDRLRESSAAEIRYFSQPNSGPAAARNRGIERSSYGVVAFLDSDDHWHKSKIEVQFEKLASNDQCRISHTREKWLRRGNHLNQKAVHKPAGGIIFPSCLRLCCVGMSTVMLEKSLCADHGLFDETLRCCEDYDYWLRVSAAEPFLLINEPLTVKEGGRADQVSVRYRVGMDRYRIYALLKLLVTAQLSAAQDRQARDMLVKKCEIYGNGCTKHGKVAEGKKILELAKAAESKLTDEHLDTIRELVRPVPLPEKNIY